MIIGIDARLYGPYHRGIGRYVQHLVDGIVATTNGHHFIVFLDERGYAQFRPSARVTAVLAPYRVYGWREQIIFPWLIGRYRVDLMHFPHFNVPLLYRGRFIATIHDLIITHHPTSRATTGASWLYQVKLRLYRIVMRSAIHRAVAIIAVSRATRDDILAHYSVDPGKVIVIYEGVDLPTQSGMGTLPTPVRPPYLLYVGSAYPHKNLERLCQAFAVVRERHPDVSLVLVGRQDYFYQRLRTELAGQAGVVFLDNVDDDQLAQLYHRALAFVFPSLIEGFGLPPLEAQACDVPVISSRATSLPEVLGEGALYFDPMDQTALVVAIDRVVSDSELRRRLIAQGRQNSTRFSWARMTLEVARVYARYEAK